MFAEEKASLLPLRSSRFVTTSMATKHRKFKKLTQPAPHRAVDFRFIPKVVQSPRGHAIQHCFWMIRNGLDHKNEFSVMFPFPE
jgi:hypothetical protein